MDEKREEDELENQEKRTKMGRKRMKRRRRQVGDGRGKNTKKWLWG